MTKYVVRPGNFKYIEYAEAIAFRPEEPAKSLTLRIRGDAVDRIREVVEAHADEFEIDLPDDSVEVVDEHG